MDNFYDTIKLLSIKNVNKYNPVKITLENMDIKIPDVVNTIKIDKHPLQEELNDLFYKQNLTVLGINSEIIEPVKGENNWALMLDPDGFIAEGSGDNFFIVKDREVISPEGRNILRGVSRDYVKELCKGCKK